MRNKVEMRRILAARAPGVTIPAVDAGDVGAVEELLRTFGSLIVKPQEGTGSQGVRKVGTWDEYLALPDALRQRAIVEPFMEGVEVTIEALSTDGRHQAFGVVEKRTQGNFVEVGHILPPVNLTEAQVQTAVAAVAKALDALEFTDGVTCNEVMVNGNEARIVETHNRPGGDGLTDMIESVSGVDWRKQSMAWIMGSAVTPGVSRASAVAIVFFVAPPGRVIHVLGQPSELPRGVEIDSWRVWVAPGDQVEELRSSDDRLGMARLLGASATDCEVALDSLLGANVVTTRPA